MKKRVVILFLIFAFVLCIALPFGSKSYADPFTAYEIGGIAYAAMTGWGIDFSVIGGTAQGVSDFMTGEIENYVNSRGGSISDVFLGNIAVDVAGKLVVGQQMYNSIIQFKDWLVSKFGINDNYIDIDAGTIGGITYAFSEPYGTGYRMEYIAMEGGSPRSYTRDSGSGFCWRGVVTEIGVTSSGSVYVITPLDRSNGQPYNERAFVDFSVQSVPYQNRISWNGTNYVAPTVLNPDKEWTGTIGGQDWPDTNLDQLIGQIYSDIADNNLDVDGEITDVTPVPPGPVPTWTPVDDVIGGINGLGEEVTGIGNDIGDISGHLDDIGEQVGNIGDKIGDVTGGLEGVQQGIQTQTGAISGAMDQAAQDVVDAIGSQTAALDESLTATAEGIQDITDILTAPEIETSKFDLRELFPFCIPFDIYHLLQKFDGTPTAPHVQIPIVIPSIGFSYTMDLDFSAWDPLASAMRTVELIVYALGLAWATSKAIKW